MTCAKDAAVYVREVVKSLNKRIDRIWEVEAQKSGLTRAQVLVLQELYQVPGISLKDLSRQLGMAHSTVSGIIDRLEKKEYVERRTDTRDKRLSRLYLSDQVDVYVNNQLPQSLDASLISALSRLKDEEREQILVGLKLLQEAVLKDEGV